MNYIPQCKGRSKVLPGRYQWYTYTGQYLVGKVAFNTCANYACVIVRLCNNINNLDILNCGIEFVTMKFSDVHAYMCQKCIEQISYFTYAHTTIYSNVPYTLSNNNIQLDLMYVLQTIILNVNAYIHQGWPLNNLIQWIDAEAVSKFVIQSLKTKITNMSLKLYHLTPENIAKFRSVVKNKTRVWQKNVIATTKYFTWL